MSYDRAIILYIIHYPVRSERVSYVYCRSLDGVLAHSHLLISDSIKTTLSQSLSSQLVLVDQCQISSIAPSIAPDLVSYSDYILEDYNNQISLLSITTFEDHIKSTIIDSTSDYYSLDSIAIAIYLSDYTSSLSINILADLWFSLYSGLNIYDHNVFIYPRSLASPIGRLNSNTIVIPITYLQSQLSAYDSIAHEHVGVCLLSLSFNLLDLTSAIITTSSSLKDAVSISSDLSTKLLLPTVADTFNIQDLIIKYSILNIEADQLGLDELLNSNQYLLITSTVGYDENISISLQSPIIDGLPFNEIIIGTSFIHANVSDELDLKYLLLASDLVGAILYGIIINLSTGSFTFVNDLPFTPAYTFRLRNNGIYTEADSGNGYQSTIGVNVSDLLVANKKRLEKIKTNNKPERIKVIADSNQITITPNSHVTQIPRGLRFSKGLILLDTYSDVEFVDLRLVTEQRAK